MATISAMLGPRCMAGITFSVAMLAVLEHAPTNLTHGCRSSDYGVEKSIARRGGRPLPAVVARAG